MMNNAIDIGSVKDKNNITNVISVQHNFESLSLSGD